MNNNQNKMELDGYNEDLKIAFEYNGEQHYKKIKKYNQTDLDLKQRKLDDRMKSEICLVKGIKLVVIPPFKQTDNEQLITEKLYALLLKNKIVAPEGDIKINYQKAFDSGELQEMRDIAKSHGGSVYLKAILECIEN